MNKLIIVLVASIFLSGCAVVVDPVGVKEVTVTMMEPDLIPAASLGMKRVDVVKALDREMVAAARKKQDLGALRTFQVRSLDSIEMVEVNGITYQVDTYIVSAGQPGDGEGVPLIYQDGILIGKGRAELTTLKARAER